MDPKQMKYGDYPVGTTWRQAEDSSPAHFYVTDHLARQVILTSKQWNQHIILGHPELDGLLALVEAAVSRPAVVTREKGNPNRECYYLAHRHPGIVPLHVKVVVHFDDSVHHRFRVDGFVVTAYLTRRVHPMEVRLWP